MKAVFLADAHLTQAGGPGYGELISFFDELKAGRQRSGGIYIDELFLVGDFFDFWFSKGENVYPPFQEVLNKLIALKEAGISIHLSEGNHDFFLADYFSDYLGMEVYPDWADVELDGLRILVSHGDTIGASDLSYRLLRRLLRSRFFYNLQRLLPLPWLFALARLSSLTSRGLGRDRTEYLAVEFQAFARERLAAGFDAVLLGHCHLPLLHRYNMGGREAVSAIIGGWNAHQSYLYLEDGAFRLCSFRRGKGPEKDRGKGREKIFRS